MHIYRWHRPPVHGKRLKPNSDIFGQMAHQPPHLASPSPPPISDVQLDLMQSTHGSLVGKSTGWTCSAPKPKMPPTPCWQKKKKLDLRYKGHVCINSLFKCLLHELTQKKSVYCMRPYITHKFCINHFGNYSKELIKINKE